MRIAIDARWIFPRISGIGRVTEKIISYLAAAPGGAGYLVIFNQPELHDRFRRQWSGNPAVDFAMVPWGPYSPFSQLLLPLYFRRWGVDVYHSPNYLCPFFRGGAGIVVTVHDLIPLKFPHFTPRARKIRFHFLFRWLINRAVHRADAVIAVSGRTRTDLINVLGVPAAKIRVIYNGVDDLYRPRDKAAVREKLRRDYRVAFPYFLFVGRLDPYKNVPGLIAAFARCRQRLGGEVRLVIVASPDPRYPESRVAVKELGLGDRVMFIDGVAVEEDLAAFYGGAEALILPSLWEGFGLPPLEAMACGTPVICSDRGALPEVVGSAAILVDPEKKEELAAAMQAVIQDQDLRGRLREQGLQRAAKFSWSVAAAQTLDLYRELTAAR